MTSTAAPAPARFLLNGQTVRIDAEPPHTTLLDFVRARGLTGAKEGCAEGECGACTVVMVAPDEGGSAYRTVNSCLMFLPMAAGREIYTVEALASEGRLHEVQEAMAAAGGSQCGYCTPGFVMSLFAEQYRRGRSGPCDPLALAGNLCRCTGYRPIRDAVSALGPAPDDRFRDRLAQHTPALDAVTLDGFSRPTSIEECTAILARDPAATLVAGGSDLCVESNLRGRRWPHLVSVDGIPALQSFSDETDAVQIGAALPLSDIGRRWRDAPPVIDEWLEQFASPPIRNRATLGGNLATASPIGDSAPLLLALDAAVHVAGAGGARVLPLAEFFTAYRRTALRPGELITRIAIPKPLPPLIRFYKVAKRRLDDISTVAAAMAIERDRTGRVQRARMAFGGVTATPVRLVEAENALVGLPWNESAVERVQHIVERTLTPMSDHRGSREYRLRVATCLVEKFWWETRS